MVEQKNLARVKLRKISVLELSYIFSVFGLIFGVLNGFPFFVVVRSVMGGWGMANVPVAGLALLSFVVFPLILALLSFIMGLISGGIINLTLKMFKGLDMIYEELD